MEKIKNLNKMEKENSVIVKIIKSIKKDNSIYYSNLTSAHVPDNADLLRIRNDYFLNDAINNKEPFLVSGFTYRYTTIFIVIKGQDFQRYKGRTNQNNTFITINKNLLDEIIDLNYSNESNIFVDNRSLGKINIFISNIDNLDKEELESFIS